MASTTSGSTTFAQPDANILSPNSDRLQRLQSLDVLKAIAVLGGLLVSIWIFGGFTNNKQLQLLLKPTGSDYRMYSFILLLVQGKMLAIISLVFGAGMVLYFSKKNEEGKLPVADLYIRKQLWLLGFGLLNALLFLWSGDVLFHLAILGILLFPFVRLSARGLLIASVLATAIFCGKNYWKYSDDKKAYSKYIAILAFEKKLRSDSLARVRAVQTSNIDKKTIYLARKDSLSKQQQADKKAWEGTLKNMKYDPKKDEGENKEMQTTSFGNIWTNILPSTQYKQSVWTYQTGIWEISSMMLFGMALFKFGFFNDRLSRNKYLLLAAAALIAGLMLGWFRLHYNIFAVADYTKYILNYSLPHTLFFPFEKLLITLAYASGVMFLIRFSKLAFVWKALAAVGKLSLTNYLLQSVICTLFFTGYGMGYFGRLQQNELYFLVVEIWIGQIVFSVLWLRKFKYGPAEWLWRCLTYATWFPARENPPSAERIVTLLS